MKNPIYQIQNTALAVTLSTLGIPFAKDETGKTVPFLNVYDPGTLRRLGYAGWNMLEAARDAVAKKKLGIIHYQFARVPLLESIVTAFNRRQEQINESDLGQGPQPPDVDIDPELAAKFACQLMKNRAVFGSGWQNATPMLVIPGESSSVPDPERPGGKVITGSCRMVSLNASEPLLTRLGL